jgi:phospholipase A-2-activating protein
MCVAYIPPNDNFPDGAIVTGGSDSSLIIWNFENGNVMFVLSGHQNSISAVAYSKKHNYIISGSWDQFGNLVISYYYFFSTIRIWVLGDQIKTITSHNQNIQSFYVDDSKEIFLSCLLTFLTINVYLSCQ